MFATVMCLWLLQVLVLLGAKSILTNINFQLLIYVCTLCPVTINQKNVEHDTAYPFQSSTIKILMFSL
jgi:hypothetical protein